MRTFSSLAIVLSAAVLLAACSSTKLDDKSAPVENHTMGTTGNADANSVNNGDANADAKNSQNRPRFLRAQRFV